MGRCTKRFARCGDADVCDLWEEWTQAKVRAEWARWNATNGSNLSNLTNVTIPAVPAGVPRGCRPEHCFKYRHFALAHCRRGCGYHQLPKPTSQNRI